MNTQEKCSRKDSGEIDRLLLHSIHGYSYKLDFCYFFFLDVKKIIKKKEKKKTRFDD